MKIDFKIKKKNSEKNLKKIIICHYTSTQNK